MALNEIKLRQINQMQAMAAARTAFSLKFSQVTQRGEGVWGWHEVTECIRMIKLLKGLRCQTIYTAFLYSILRRLCVFVCVCVCLPRKEMPRLNDDYEHLCIDAYVQEYRCKHFRHKTLKCHVDADVVAVGRGTWQAGRWSQGGGY